jgi:hypothetical protein
MHQQFWGYKVEEKLYLGVHKQKRLNTTALKVNNLKSHIIVCCYEFYYSIILSEVCFDTDSCLDVGSVCSYGIYHHTSCYYNNFMTYCLHI